ncbi:alpha/beta hydrolase [Streptomyces capparidis]
MAALLLSSCSFTASSSSGSSVENRSPSGSPGTSTTRTLRPLPAATPAALRPYYRQTLAWKPCRTSGFECATLRVPLDYAKPAEGGDIKLAVARKRARDQGARLGSLLVNPGGPGASAVDYLQQQAAVGYPAPVRDAYDLVAFDPRGVGGSVPVTCLSDADMDAFTRVDTTPDDQREIDRLVAADRRFARGCERSAARLLPHMGTVEAARDMDVLRAVLGDDKLTYTGLSYGTMIGATYAGLFPGRVGRLVLDGAMDPSVDAKEAARAQAGGFQTAFRAFAEDCVSHRGCPLGTDSADDAGRRLDAFLARLDRKPLRTRDGSRTLNEALGTTAVLLAMYDESYWPLLREALRSALDGDGSDLLRMSDVYYERQEGVYGNIMYANAAVNCLDLPPAARTPADVRKALPAFRKASANFGASMAWATLICGDWPVKPQGTPTRIEAEGAAPILVIGTTRDPATPYTWARSLASQLDSGVLLTYEGDGHTAYARGNECVDTTVNTYLLQGRPPAGNKRCS